MTVRENMGFGLRMTGVPKAEIAAKVNEAAEILRLGEYLDRKPKPCRADNGNGSPSVGPSFGVRGSFSSMSRCPTSMPN